MWRECDSCGGDIGQPTPSEVILDISRCHACGDDGWGNPVDYGQEERLELLEAVFEELKNLQQRVAVLEKGE